MGDYMNGKQQFLKACSESGINAEKIFLIGEDSYYACKNKICTKFSHNTRPKGIKCVIRYFKAIDLFVAWDLEGTVGTQDNFSLSK